MAFPTTSILDNFNRADAATLGGNWSVLKNYFGSGDIGILSNQAYGPSNTYIEMYYNVATYGPDCEIYLTLATTIPNGTADATVVLLRIQEPTGSYDGYACVANTATGSEVWSIERTDNEVNTQLGATAAQAIVDGDKMGFEAIGSTLKGYIFTSGTWTEVLSRTDATYGSAGNIAFYGSGEVITWRYDDFGGGTVVAAGTILRQMIAHHGD